MTALHACMSDAGEPLPAPPQCSDNDFLTTHLAHIKNLAMRNQAQGPDHA